MLNVSWFIMNDWIIYIYVTGTKEAEEEEEVHDWWKCRIVIHKNL